MPRTKRVAPGGMVFHALNRGVGRRRMFYSDRDYAAFEETIEDTLRLYPMRIVAYCLLPNHWHFVLWPEGDGDLSAFLQRLTNTHTQRWQRAKNKVGYGHLYQGRFKSFPVETDEHFYKRPRTEQWSADLMHPSPKTSPTPQFGLFHQIGSQRVSFHVPRSPNLAIGSNL